ncbi:cvfA/B/C family virulence factor [Roseiarcus fermentans]|uniref:CvfA/B/C family virulence factor n=1 Tax=Roseiarcus fermentans TaxID=1473586 RepID=A0A366ERC0_9HYPH|nr:virulence factor [Roseiarcus fermentans]RBP04049.1 cvfA/B/C family virulence factor [Roseiarcus fermentans]
MASLIVVSWRDIPSQVIVKAGRRSARRELSERFVRAIDAAAMRAGATSDDAYLAHWRRSAPVPCGDDLEAEAEAAAARLEAEYDADRLAQLAKHDGRERSA